MMMTELWCYTTDIACRQSRVEMIIRIFMTVFMLLMLMMMTMMLLMMMMIMLLTEVWCSVLGITAGRSLIRRLVIIPQHHKSGFMHLIIAKNIKCTTITNALMQWRPIIKCQCEKCLPKLSICTIICTSPSPLPQTWLLGGQEQFRKIHAIHPSIHPCQISEASMKNLT